MEVAVERRRRCRYHVRWPLRIYVAGRARPVEGITENLSSNGFYCIVDCPLPKGQAVRCLIELPSGTSGELLPLVLNCRAVVLRVESSSLPGQFGLACRITDYAIQSKSL
jgi:hypothetical protein